MPFFLIHALLCGSQLLVREVISLLTKMNVNMAEILLTLGFDACESRLRELVSVLWSADITTLEDFRGLRR